MRSVKMMAVMVLLPVLFVMGQQRIVMQAEEGVFTGKVSTQYTGYTGSGFVDTENATGSYIEVEFSVKAAGVDTFYAVYAHNKTDNRTAKILVNDSVVVQSLDFPPTNSWTNWQTVSTMVPVKKGMNKLRVVALTSGGLANTDRYELSAEAGSIQYKLMTKSVGRGTVTTDPTGVYFDAGTVVTLTATPQAGAGFEGWTGDLTGTQNPATITMTGNKSVTGNFVSLVAATVYCSPTGNDANPGTFEQPYYSLHKAVESVVAGDTIYMRGGTYNYNSTVFLSKTGTPAKQFVISAYPGEIPKMNWSSWQPQNETERASARGLKVTGTGAYWYLKKLDIAYAPDNGVKCEGSHITFDQCVFHHNGDGGLQIGLGKDSLSSNPDPEHLAAYNKVINCDAYRNADPATSYENADGFSCKLYAGKDNYFYGCRAWENCDDGWDCYQTNYNIFIEYCWTWHNGDPSQWGFTSFNGDGNGFKLGGNDEPCPIIIKNCIAFDSPFGAMCCYSDNNNGGPITLYNCSGWAGGKVFKLQNQPHILKNCLAFDPKSGIRFTRDLSANAVSVNNSWDLTAITADYTDFVSTNVTDAIAPRQADGSLPDNGFGRLKANSDMIDKGVDVGLPFTGIAPDLGAYEYGMAVGVQEEAKNVPAEFALLQNYPNPFNPSTTIRFSLPDRSDIRISVFDQLGRKAGDVISGAMEAGTHSIVWNASNLSSGVYYCKLSAGSRHAVRKIILLR